ncbi:MULTISPECIES: tRNA 2-selenouridine(34) synthase MnmH [Calothrix]|uniref:tRNA 2-selenouridine(34) synthase MnmH n=2 Tax=Calothrix TaxID=1186 RepID=A0ABR8A4K0_9CYAN|nr:MULTISPECIES: tRNA 2-selenouridine(34) synthase MnmH [Calothrix]MBD2193946.1 tRNA 2-selenouridine(34) synthase MnmH [Calothrix parietina FACHB-288]MBD2222953.1 tRNA 2-selenouridine(34) synthase MnmH [Calothrix anomala FACHB-343]
MLPSVTYTQRPWAESYSEIIDVRSPSEYLEDRIPGAINLPVLNDAERGEVGTIYQQVCSFTARKIGAALVTRNIYQHLSQHFAAKDPEYHPLIYCGRGGQRSNSMATVLTQIGWEVTVLEGGYKTYRNYVRQQLEHLPEKFNYRILCGLTGSGKTYILSKLEQLGAQVLDLESLAKHRGSLLGGELQTQRAFQPSQKYFETQLLQVLQKFDPNQPVWIESESNKIGQLYLPHALWQKMRESSCVEIQLPLAARVDFLLQEYSHLISSPEILKRKLEKLKYRCGWEKLIQWYQLIDVGAWEVLVQDLLKSYYDPIYNHSIGSYFHKADRVLNIPDLSDRSIANLLDSLIPNYASVTWQHVNR